MAMLPSYGVVFYLVFPLLLLVALGLSIYNNERRKLAGAGDAYDISVSISSVIGGAVVIWLIWIFLQGACNATTGKVQAFLSVLWFALLVTAIGLTGTNIDKYHDGNGEISKNLEYAIIALVSVVVAVATVTGAMRLKDYMKKPPLERSSAGFSSFLNTSPDASQRPKIVSSILTSLQ